MIKQIMNRLYQSIKLKLNSDPNSSKELVQIQSWEALTTNFLPIALGLLLSALKNSSFEKTTEFTLMLTLKKFWLLRSTPDKDFSREFQSLLTEHDDEIGQVSYDLKLLIIRDYTV